MVKTGSAKDTKPHNFILIKDIDKKVPKHTSAINANAGFLLGHEFSLKPLNGMAFEMIKPHIKQLTKNGILIP